MRAIEPFLKKNAGADQCVSDFPFMHELDQDSLTVRYKVAKASWG